MPGPTAGRAEPGERRQGRHLVGRAITWTEPGAYAVAEGARRIPLPLPQDGLRAVNLYAVATADGLVLIDGGWAVPQSRQALVDGLAGIGAGPGHHPVDRLRADPVD